MKRIIIASVVSAWIVITGMLWNVLNEQNFSFQVKQRTELVNNQHKEIGNLAKMN